VIIGTTRAVRVFAFPAAVDLRKGYDGLFGLVQTGLKRDRVLAVSVREQAISATYTPRLAWAADVDSMRSAIG
jgi:hypothetical protein